jgi:hypothetical protein
MRPFCLKIIWHYYFTTSDSQASQFIQFLQMKNSRSQRESQRYPSAYLKNLVFKVLE